MGQISNTSDGTSFVTEERRVLAVGDREVVVAVSTATVGPSSMHAHQQPASHSEAGLTTTSSALSSVFTLCNSAIGAGVLSLPYAFRNAGLIGGIILCVLIGSAEGFTLYVLSKFAERYEAQTYGVLVRRALGKKLTALLAGIMVCYLWGACTVYLIIMGDTFSALGSPYLAGTPYAWLGDRNVLIAGLGLLVQLPLCMLKQLGHLSSLSAMAVAGFMFTASVVLFEGVSQTMEREPHLQGVVLWKLDLGTLYAIPIITFGFNCHSNVVSIFTELTPSTDMLFSSLPSSPRGFRRLHTLAPKPASHKLVNMLGVILGAVVVIMVGYVCVGVSGYLGYPTSVGSNVLNSLPQDKLIVQAAQGLIGFVVLSHYPLTHFPARTGVHDVFSLLGLEGPGEVALTLFTTVFVGGSVGLALVVHSLGDALHLIGGTAASFMIFFLPGLMLINEAVKKNSTQMLSALQHQDIGNSHTLSEPLLRLAVEKGIKKTGIVYSPGKSWAAGSFLVVLSLLILMVTIGTTVYKPSV